jgi:hypothetical protein
MIWADASNRAQRQAAFRTSRTWNWDCAVTTIRSGRALGPVEGATRVDRDLRCAEWRVVRARGTKVLRRI